MKNSRFLPYRTILYFSSIVWLVNGLFFKILDFIPRHEQIISRILGATNSNLFTISIGVGEMFIAFWILSLWKSRLCVIVQIGLVLIMNVLEFLLVPDILMFGRFNLIFAILFCLLLYYKEFKLKEYE